MSLQEIPSDELTLREAAAVVGRTQASLKGAVQRGALRGSLRDGAWRVRRDDLLEWNAAHPPKPSSHRPAAWERALDLLQEYGSLSVNELAVLTSRDVGNARKHLAILGAQGRATRRPDGQWVLTSREAGAA